MDIAQVVCRFLFGFDSSKSKMLLCVLSMLLVHLTREVTCDHSSTAPAQMYSAVVNITYEDPRTGDIHSYVTERTRYGTESRMDSEWGWVVHARTIDNKTDGCKEIVNVPKVRWIALIERGGCKFQEKIYNAAIEKNASAVVVYNHKDESDVISMQHKGNYFKKVNSFFV